MRKYDGTIQYARDKRRQVALAERFDALWRGQGVHAYAMHPGWTETEGVKRDIPGFWDTFKNSFRPLEQGADTITYLALQVRTHAGVCAFFHAGNARHHTVVCLRYMWREALCQLPFMR